MILALERKKSRIIPWLQCSSSHWDHGRPFCIGIKSSWTIVLFKWLFLTWSCLLILWRHEEHDKDFDANKQLFVIGLGAIVRMALNISSWPRPVSRICNKRNLFLMDDGLSLATFLWKNFCFFFRPMPSFSLCLLFWLRITAVLTMLAIKENRSSICFGWWGSIFSPEIAWNLLDALRSKPMKIAASNCGSNYTWINILSDGKCDSQDRYNVPRRNSGARISFLFRIYILYLVSLVSCAIRVILEFASSNAWQASIKSWCNVESLFGFFFCFDSDILVWFPPVILIGSNLLNFFLTWQSTFDGYYYLHRSRSTITSLLVPDIIWIWCRFW